MLNIRGNIIRGENKLATDAAATDIRN